MPQGTVYIYIIGIAIKSIGTKAKNTTNLLALANFLSALYCFLNFKKCFSEHFDIGEKKKENIFWVAVMRWSAAFRFRELKKPQGCYVRYFSAKSALRAFNLWSALECVKSALYLLCFHKI